MSAENVNVGYSGFSGTYLGEELPGCRLEPFVPELFSVWGDYGYHLTTSVYFSPGNSVLFFSDQTLPATEGRGGAIWVMQQGGGYWTQPQKVSFSGKYVDKIADISQNGKKLFFSSTRPVRGHGSPKDSDIWYVERQDDEWSEPVRLDHPINTVRNELGCGLTMDGTAYFSSDRPGGLGGFDIYYARLISSGYVVENLGPCANTEAEEFVVYAAHDGSFLIFYRDCAAERIESGLYIVYHNNGNWTNAVSMGDHINAIHAREASVSPDGKYLFLLSPGNGIYWLKSDIIDYLRTESLEVSRELLAMALAEGTAAALEVYHELKKKHARYVDIDEYLVNQRGYDYLDAGRFTEAVVLFGINLALFPDSWNAHDSMGEAYFQAGRLELAAQCYEKSLELNPDNEHAMRVLEHIRSVLRD